jgi:peptide/nickel transport system substrate-binding protein
MPKLYKIALPSVSIADPHLCTDSHAINSIRKLLFQSLFYYNGFSIEGLIAEDFKIEDSGKKWIINLKKEFYFPNNRQLTSKDVIYSLKRASSSDREGLLFAVTYNYYIGLSKFRAIDKYRVEIINPKPISDLRDILLDLSIIPEGWTSYLDGTGTGPFILEDYNKSEVRLSRRRNKKITGSSDLTLEFLHVPVNLDRVNLLRDSKCDLILDPPMNVIEKFKKSAEIGVAPWDTNLSVIFLINCKTPPFNNPLFRQALNYAVDIEKLIQVCINGHGKPLNGPFSDRHSGYNPNVKPYAFNPAKSKQLIGQVGVDTEFTLAIHAPTSLPDEAPTIARFLAESYEEVGLKCDVCVHEDRVEYARKIAEKELEGIFCFDSSPLSTYKVLTEKLDSRVEGKWWQGYKSDTFNELLSLAAATIDDDQRKTIYQKATNLLHNEAPWVFLYQPKRFWIYRKDFKPYLAIDSTGYPSFGT